MSKDKIAGDFYSVGHQLFSTEASNFEIDNADFQLYEVMRCKNCKLIFEQDHLIRLEKGLQHIGYNATFPGASVSEMLKNMVEANKCRSGNVKLYASFTGEKLKLAAGYVPHNYPPEELYRKGVELKSFRIERSDPTIKQISVSSKIQSSLIDKIDDTYYETLLIDSQGNVTEGSKTNFFLLRNDELYSAPEKDILPGITRKYVLQVAKKLNVRVNKQKIQLEDLKNYSGAFICGTSPKVLPVRKIDSMLFSPEHVLIQKFICEYEMILTAQAGD